MTQNPPRLLDQVRNRIRLRGYSIRTEKSYIGWIKRYIYFHGKRHPMLMGKPEIEAFLSDLAFRGNVSASTQNLAYKGLAKKTNEQSCLSFESSSTLRQRPKT